MLTSTRISSTMQTHGMPATARGTVVWVDQDPRSATSRVFGVGMKLHLNDAKVAQILDLYRMYLEQEEELKAPVSDIVEGIVLYFLDEHPQFRAWNAHRRLNEMGTSHPSSG